MDMKKVVSILKREKGKTTRTKDAELYDALVLAIGCIEGTMDNTAKWIWTGEENETAMCSRCCYETNGDLAYIKEHFHFCPSCGAYMGE